MLDLRFTSKFEKDYKLIKKRNYDISKLKTVVLMLRNREQLPAKYLDHALNGKYTGYRECHIEPDWLLVYKIEDENLILTLIRTGTHSDLFG